MGLTAFSQGMYMLRWLKALVDWVFSRRSSLTLLSLQAPNAGEASRGGRRRLDPPQGPSDPDSRVRAPRWHGPKGRSASIAVAEPDDDESVVAIGGHDSAGLGANRRSSCKGLTVDGPVEARCQALGFIRPNLRLRQPATIELSRAGFAGHRALSASWSRTRLARRGNWQ